MYSSNTQTLSVPTGKNSHINLPLEFEGTRAFAVWDTVKIRGYRFQMRIEVNPKLLRKQHGDECPAYLYCGKLPLPRPELN
jgi:hypothetical protein